MKWAAIFWFGRRGGRHGTQLVPGRHKLQYLSFWFPLCTVYCRQWTHSV